jgi:hypothetical protein
MFIGILITPSPPQANYAVYSSLVLDRDGEKNRLARTWLVQLALDLAIAPIVRADPLPIELKALVD